MKNNGWPSWALRLIAAAIMLQTLYFKFTGQEESVQLFSLLGLEPYGRIGVGVGELVASVLLLIPRTTWLGAALGVGLMLGAIFFHLTILGIFFGGDALLFIYAVIVLIACSILLWINRANVVAVLSMVKGVPGKSK